MSNLLNKGQRFKWKNTMDATLQSMFTHNINQSIQNIIKKFQHSHSNLNFNDNQILQHIQTLRKRTQIIGGEKTKSMSPTIKYFNDIKDTPKYSCVCCQRLWFKHQLTHSLKQFLK